VVFKTQHLPDKAGYMLLSVGFWRPAMARPFAAFSAALITTIAALAIAGPATAQDSPLETAATHAVIMDYETGIVLYSKDGNEPMPPASMSKIMTILHVMDLISAGSLSLDTEFEVSEDAWRRGGFASGSSNMCLEPRQRVSVEDLIRGVIVLSGNDAAIVLAQGISGSEPAFAAELNEKAIYMGLENAHFANATGWPHAEHRVSARDLAEIARVTIAEHGDLYAIYAEREFDWCVSSPSNRFNRNPLLGVVAGVDGLKTGHTEESGYGLVASGVRNGVRRIVVFNGMTSQRGRANEAERLMRAAFADFRVATPFSDNQEVGEVPVFMGEADSVPVRIGDGVTIGYHRRSARDVAARLVYDGPLRAPISAGDEVGMLVLEVPGGETVERTIYATTDVAQLGLMGRAKAGLVHLIRSTNDN